MIQLGGLTFSPGAITGYVYNEVTDWYSLPSSKMALASRPQAHGAFGLTTDWREAPTISFSGWYLGADRASLLAAKQSLAAVDASGAMLPMTLTDELGATTRTVSVRSVQISDDRGRNEFQFAVILESPDPLRYGAEVTATTGLPTAGTGMAWPQVYPIDWGTAGNPGRLTIANVGTADSWPTFTVPGQLDAGFSLVELGSGREIRFERVVPIAGAPPLTMDSRTGRALLGTGDVSGFLTKAEWFPVPAGGSSTVQFSALGGFTSNPILTMKVRPAWW